MFEKRLWFAYVKTPTAVLHYALTVKPNYCHFFPCNIIIQFKKKKTNEKKRQCSVSMTHRWNETQRKAILVSRPDADSIFHFSDQLFPPLVVCGVSEGAKSQRRITGHWGRSAQSSRPVGPWGEASALVMNELHVITPTNRHSTYLQSWFTTDDSPQNIN